jgi:NAD(P)H-dependent flavin oxidoreductase YrpB (nitropropane dioxygenase family)
MLHRDKLLEWIIIQAGMGAGVSDYNLARKSSIVGNGKVLGVVSGVALNEIMVRRLQNGDPSGKIRHALSKFPDQETAREIIDKYFIEGGKPSEKRYHSSPFPGFNQDSDRVLTLNKDLEKLIIAANFVEVFLAKEGHDNPIGINYLYKIQWPFLPSVYGAMLAGVDATLIGAGFPCRFSKVLDGFSVGESATIQIPVGETKETYFMKFDPKNIFENCPELDRPFFIGIEGNHLGAKAVPDADGYVGEKDIGGGHSAPCRSGELTSRGEPEYGPKDAMDLEKFSRILDKNEQANGYRQQFWRAGGYADKLKQAQEEGVVRVQGDVVIVQGAVGVQVGSLFEWCRQSGLSPELRERGLNIIMDETLDEIVDGKIVYRAVFKDPRVSTSGFPFNVLQVPETLSERSVYDARTRRCDLGYLAELYLDGDKINLRCPGEIKEVYINKKRGKIEDTIRRGCLCNSLITNLGLGSFGEMPLITQGSDLSSIRAVIKKHGRDYGVEEAIDYILNPY